MLGEAGRRAIALARLCAALRRCPAMHNLWLQRKKKLPGRCCESEGALFGTCSVCLAPSLGRAWGAHHGALVGDRPVVPASDTAGGFPPGAKLRMHTAVWLSAPWGAQSRIWAQRHALAHRPEGWACTPHAARGERRMGLLCLGAAMQAGMQPVTGASWVAPLYPSLSLAAPCSRS